MQLPLMIGLPGLRLEAAERRWLERLRPAAIILFRRNCEDESQVRALTDDLRTTLGPDLLIAIDEEGGLVSRIDSFCSAAPAAAAIARALGRGADPNLPVRAARLTARRLALLGINFNLAPVFDLDHHPGSANALGGRCWGSTMDAVLAGAGPWLETTRDERILSCAKHFPGAGLAQSDPHHGLPRVDADLATLETELQPFSALLDRLDSVMVSHLHYSAISGPGPVPASLEPAILTGLLRDRLGFDGPILTDDLEMDAVMALHSIEDATLAALHAGADLPLVCHRPDRIAGAARALAGADPARLDDALRRLERLRQRPTALRPLSPAAWNSLQKDAEQLQREVCQPVTRPAEGSPVERF